MSIRRTVAVFLIAAALALGIGAIPTDVRRAEGITLVAEVASATPGPSATPPVGTPPVGAPEPTPVPVLGAVPPVLGIVVGIVLILAMSAYAGVRRRRN
jgi:hypothetical protein